MTTKQGKWDDADKAERERLREAQQERDRLARQAQEQAKKNKATK